MKVSIDCPMPAPKQIVLRLQYLTPSLPLLPFLVHGAYELSRLLGYLVPPSLLKQQYLWPAHCLLVPLNELDS